MALITLRELLDHASQNNYAIPAFTINNLEVLRAVMQAANNTNSPVIVQAIAGSRKYAGPRFLRHLILAATEEFPHIPLCMQYDHGTSPNVCFQAMQLGVTSVMMDGSLLEDLQTPASYEYNVATTSAVVKMAHACGVSVEGELGCLASKDHIAAQNEQGLWLTDPDQAVDFVSATGIDALAIAIGTCHGAHKFSALSGAVLDMQRIQDIHTKIPNVPLVIHGASTVAPELLKIINQYGGEVKKSYGVPLAELKQAIKYGVRKINTDTDLRLAYIGALRRSLTLYRSELDPRKFNGEAINAMQKICEERYNEFGAAGQASRIKPLLLEQMAVRYANGSLK
jgi:fructose-bisphosphate aldolase class II